MQDPYLYNGTEILINLFDERNENRLKEIEANYTSLRLRQLFENPIRGKFGFAHLCKMHRFIFQDIYKWAGKIRTINITKTEAVLGGLSVEYSDKNCIEIATKKVLYDFSNINWQSKNVKNLSKNFAKNMALLWKIHPFREGNTRTVINFCCDMARKRGILIKRELFEENSLYVRNALVAANAIFKDIGDKSNCEYLHRIVFDAMNV
jgi:cell filamentation protein